MALIGGAGVHLLIPLIYVGSAAFSLWFAWKRSPRGFAIAYAVGWAEILAGSLFIMAGPHGSHGQSIYMFEWGLMIVGPAMAIGLLFVGVLAGAIAWLSPHERTAPLDD